MSTLWKSPCRGILGPQSVDGINNIVNCLLFVSWPGADVLKSYCNSLYIQIWAKAQPSLFWGNQAPYIFNFNWGWNFQVLNRKSFFIEEDSTPSTRCSVFAEVRNALIQAAVQDSIQPHSYSFKGFRYYSDIWTYLMKHFPQIITFIKYASGIQ